MAKPASDKNPAGAPALYADPLAPSCSSDSDCGSGFCSGGVCCDTACTDQCSSCNLPRKVGTCSAKDDTTGCDDGNSCTVGDMCFAGTCIPGTATASTCVGGSNYVPIIDLGSSQGLSYARAINHSGQVVGTDTLVENYIDDAPNVSGARAFVWSLAGGRVYLPTPVQESYADGINDDGVISGVLSPTLNGVLYPFRYDGRVDTQPVVQNVPGGSGGINSNGTMTGGAYFPSGLNMFRIGTGDAEVLPSIPNADLTYEIAIGNAIGEDGTVVGQQLTPNNYEAIRYSDVRGTEALNGLLPGGSDWNLVRALGIKSLTPVSGVTSTAIVGYGVHPSTGVVGAFRLTVTPAGDYVNITDLGISSQYDPALYIVEAVNESVNGEIVGAVYDSSGTVPVNAFVYTDATKMVSLNGLADPDSGWDLRLASAINDNHEVAGFGYLNGQPRAFKLTLPAVTACPPPSDPCQGVAVRDPLTGTCSYPPINEGGACGSNLCVTGQTCQSGVCSAGTPVTCAGAEACHSAGVCDPATGFCSNTASNNDTPCDDGNRCTVGDKCESGVCIPGNATNCSAPGDNHYLAVTDLGSSQGLSYARAINNNSQVAGTDTLVENYIYDSPNVSGARAFVWSQGGERVYLPASVKESYADGINDDGVISGVLSPPLSGALFPFRYDARVDTQPVVQNVAGGSGGINSNGTMTGGAYFPSGLNMFRIGTGAVDVLPSIPNANLTYEIALGNAIGEDGTVVGQQLTPDNYEAVRYSDIRGTEALDGLLPADSDWNLVTALGIKSLPAAPGATSTEIVGYGVHPSTGVMGAFRLKVTPTGDYADITDLGILSQYDPALYKVEALNESATGEIVGAVYDSSGTVPTNAFVYTDATNMVDLNGLVDPASGWDLRQASAINDHHEVVGFGYLNGQPRAFNVDFASSRSVWHSAAPRTA